MTMPRKAYLFVALFVAVVVPQTFAQTHGAPRDVNYAAQLLIKGKSAEGEALLRKLVKRGDLESTIFLGAYLGKSGRTKEAVAMLTPLANNGNADAQWYLSVSYNMANPPDIALAENGLPAPRQQEMEMQKGS